MPLKPLSLLLVAVVAGGCAAPGTAPENRQPAVRIPNSWGTNVSEGRINGWLTEFGDPELTRLVNEAVAHNFELKSAAGRVQEARAQARITAADRLPQTQVTAAATHSEAGSAADSVAPGGASDRLELQGQLSWEADLWGRLSDESRAAYSDWRAARADYDGARLSLAANIARQWFAVIDARAQTRLARETVESFRKSLETIENQYRQGLGAALDVRLARNNLAAAHANLMQRQRQEHNLTRGLEILAGRYPAGEMKLPETLPDISRPVPAGLPAQLLERRPDLVAAASRLEASGYRLAASEKNRLPDISLTAGGGNSSSALRRLLDLDSFVWTLAANVVQPVFQGGRLSSERDLAAARDDQAVNDYAETTLTAFREVEDALDSEAYLVAQEQATRNAAREAHAAETLAEEQYRRGLTDIVTLLEAQRRKFNADSALIEVTNLRLQNRIDLHLALGGDFKSGAEPQTASSE